MKNLFYTLSFCLLSTLLFGQEKEIQKEAETEMQADVSKDEYRTLFTGTGKSVYGGYGALTPQLSQLLDQGVLFLGARGMWVINHKFGMGLGGYFNVNGAEKQFDRDTSNGLISSEPSDSINGPAGSLRMFYGGMYFEYTILPNSPIHVSIPVLLGGGYSFYFNKEKFNKDNSNNQTEEPRDLVFSRSGFLILQPGLDLEMNMTKFLRVGVNFSYRMLLNVDLLQTEKTALDGFNTGLSLKFGKF